MTTNLTLQNSQNAGFGTNTGNRIANLKKNENENSTNLDNRDLEEGIENSISQLSHSPSGMSSRLKEKGWEVEIIQEEKSASPKNVPSRKRSSTQISKKGTLPPLFNRPIPPKVSSSSLLSNSSKKEILEIPIASTNVNNQIKTRYMEDYDPLTSENHIQSTKTQKTLKPTPAINTSGLFNMLNPFSPKQKKNNYSASLGKIENKFSVKMFSTPQATTLHPFVDPSQHSISQPVISPPETNNHDPFYSLDKKGSSFSSTESTNSDIESMHDMDSQQQEKISGKKEVRHPAKLVFDQEKKGSSGSSNGSTNSDDLVGSQSQSMPVPDKKKAKRKLAQLSISLDEDTEIDEFTPVPHPIIATEESIIGKSHEYGFVTFLKEIFDSLNKISTASPSSKAKDADEITQKFTSFVASYPSSAPAKSIPSGKFFNFAIPPSPAHHVHSSSTPTTKRLFSPAISPNVNNPKSVMDNKIAAIKEKLETALTEIDAQLDFFKLEGTYKNLENFQFGQQDDSYGFVKTDLRAIINDYLNNTEARNLYVEGLIARLGYHMKDFEADKAKIQELYNISGSHGQFFLLYMGFLMSNKRKIMTASKELEKIKKEMVGENEVA